MLVHQKIAIALMFIPLAIGITYMDVRYRRIPNKLVFSVLVAGLMFNTLFGQWHGLTTSLGGLALAFGLMFILHIFGTMGAGDVKLFAAIGSMVGVSQVVPTLFVVALSGGVLAIGKMIYARRVGRTMFGVAQFFYGLLPGQTVPRFEIPGDHSVTLPYAVPICFGGLVSLFLFGA
ncbi:MAG TPA: prepilin peptidase [Pyrinomonadaceae bacterium]|jgi:prepilin peptidase CpaA